MPSTTEERRGALKQRLVRTAEEKIITGGPDSIRARDLAKEAGCAVGAIYNIYDDLTQLIMEVNGRTFRRLGEFVSMRIASNNSKKPLDHLVIMGHAYMDFACRNTNAWRTLFALEMPEDAQVPEWYRNEMRKLFGMIAEPLSKLHPNQDQAEIMLITRALFSSVHGIVLLGLEERISAVPVPSMERMIDIVIRKTAA